MDNNFHFFSNFIEIFIIQMYCFQKTIQSGLPMQLSDRQFLHEIQNKIFRMSIKQNCIPFVYNKYGTDLLTIYNYKSFRFPKCFRNSLWSLSNKVFRSMLI